MNLLEFHQVGKRYSTSEERMAIENIEFTVGMNAFMAITGPSGSGKTTLLNLAAGLDEPTEGWISVLGQRLDGLDALARSRLRLRKMGFVFQAYNLLPVFSACENVEFTCLLQGKSRAEARAQAIEALDRVGLKAFAHRFPSQLSGGQQQRVAVARALASKPAIVFADEPTANLDSENAFQLIELFKRLNRENQIAFIFSTHDRRLIDRVDECISMVDGKIASKGKPQ